MKRIRVTVGGDVVAEVDAVGELVVGRAEGVDIRINDPEVSSKHLRIRAAGDDVFVTDLGSTNGTGLDDGTLAPNTEVSLSRGQKLMLGQAMIEVMEPAADAGDDHSGDLFEAEQTVAVGGAGMQEALISVARFKAAAPRLVIAAAHDRRTVAIQEMEAVIGRDGQDCQVEIPHGSVSSKHAAITYKDGAFEIRDLGSSNGTAVSGTKITGPTPLAPETALTIGTIECLFTCNQPESEDAGRLSEQLTKHAVAMSKITQAQSRQILDEHRKSGRPVGELLVEKGMLKPAEWAEYWKQRDVIATLGSGAGGQAAGGGGKVWIVIALIAVAVAVAAVLMNM
jgi:pSer/pThr/pTyr-binding forkhead associated (FHA) protein